MDGVLIPNLPADAGRVLSLGVIVGSFDPLHHGHEWMVRRLLARCDRVLLLVPAHHFDKTIRPPANATFAQRLAMIARLSRRLGGRVLGGVTREVLFVRLAAELETLFPGADITFGMGDDTWRRLLRSAEYYARLGLDWTAADAARLARLRRHVVVFGRSGDGPGRVTVPAALRGISSTRVRALAGAAPDADLVHLVDPDILAYIRGAGLYRGEPHPACGSPGSVLFLRRRAGV
jgi:cytidyltransferase-like protein